MVLTPRMSYQREFLGQGMFYCGPSGALFRTGVLRKLGGFPDRGVASDYCFWLKACAVTSGGARARGPLLVPHAPLPGAPERARGERLCRGARRVLAGAPFEGVSSPGRRALTGETELRVPALEVELARRSRGAIRSRLAAARECRDSRLRFDLISAAPNPGFPSREPARSRRRFRRAALASPRDPTGSRDR